MEADVRFKYWRDDLTEGQALFNAPYQQIFYVVAGVPKKLSSY